MTRKLGLIIGVVVVIAVLAILGFTQFSKQPSLSKKNTETQQNLNQTSPSTKGSIKSLLASGKNVSCNISMPDQQGSGKVFVSGTKVRGDFTMQVDGKELSSHMVSDGAYIYVWTDTSNQGTKFKTDTKAPTASNQPQTTDLDKEVDLNCSNWSLDNSKFTVPGNIQFSDLSQMMNLQSSTGSSSLPKVDKLP